MAEENKWVEDRRYVLSFIDDTKETLAELAKNDAKIQTTIAVLGTKIATFTFIGSTVVGAIVSIIVNTVTK